MGDSMVQAISRCGKFRAVAAVTTNVVETLRRRHGMLPPAVAALGRTLTGAFLMTGDLKGEERVIIQVLGNGPLAEIFVEVDSLGNGRGYVRNPLVQLPAESGKIPVSKAVGTRGTLTVIKDLALREPYRGVVPITSGEIGKDLAYYLSVSEQIPSAVALGVYVESDLSVAVAGGYLISTLPGAASKDISVIENNIQWLPVPSELICHGVSPEEMLTRVLEGFDLRFLGDRSLRFHCRCSDERVSGALIALGVQELEDLLRNDGEARITCECCQETYIFPEARLRRMVESLRSGYPVEAKNS